MKYCLILTPALFIFISCNQKTGKNNDVIFDSSLLRAKVDTTGYSRTLTYNDTAYFPFHTEDTFGYFKGYISVPFSPDSFSSEKNTGNIIQRNLSKKDIVILNTKTLSHSLFIDQKAKLRIDSFRLGEILIVSTYRFGNKRSQKISINGHTASFVSDKTDSTYDIDPLAILAGSFRDFTFKGQEFYYMEAGLIDAGGTYGLTQFYLFYNIKNKALSVFSDFRVTATQFFGDADGDDQLDVINIENEGGYGIDSVNNFKARLYSCNRSGKFELRKDKKGIEYYIDGNSGQDYYVDSMIIEKSYWPVKLK